MARATARNVLDAVVRRRAFGVRAQGEDLAGPVAAGTAILLVEQNARLAAAITERAHLLARGAIETEGATETLAQDPCLTEPYLG